MTPLNLVLMELKYEIEGPMSQSIIEELVGKVKKECKKADPLRFYDV